MTTNGEHGHIGEHDWQLLFRLIKPEWKSKLARRFGVGTSSIGRWLRQPASDNALNGTGAHSPLRRNCVLVQEVFHFDIKAAGEIAEYTRRFYRSLLAQRAVTGFGGCRNQLSLATTQMMGECLDVLKCAVELGVTAETLREAIEARDVLDFLILRCEAEMQRCRETSSNAA